MLALYLAACHSPEFASTVSKCSWRWTQKASETCTAILQLQINILSSCITLVLLYILTYDARKPKHKSNNGLQFTSPLWPNKLKELAIETQFAPIGHPQSYPSEGRMKETGKLRKIYCHQPHRKWPELLPKIEEWLNDTVAYSTGYIRMELV